MKKPDPLTLLLIIMLAGFSGTAYAADKAWSGSGDASLWTDKANWFPVVVPSTSDDVTIDAANVSVKIDGAFNAKSLKIGQFETSTLTVQNFVSGAIAPSAGTDIAIYNLSGGTIVLQGTGGVVTVRGQYKDSEQTAVSQPSFLFLVE